MARHDTACMFVFHRDRRSHWRVGLINHPRLGRWMLPGGHVEKGESPLEAALRETDEETSLRDLTVVSLPELRAPAGFPTSRVLVPSPWWTIAVDVPPDSHHGDAHVHVDHEFVALVEDPDSAGPAEHEFGWFTHNDLADLAMFEDTRLLMAPLFDRLDQLAES